MDKVNGQWTKFQFSIVNYQLVQRIQEADGKFIPGRLVLRQLEVGQLDGMRLSSTPPRQAARNSCEGVEISVRGRNAPYAARVLRDERGLGAMKPPTLREATGVPGHRPARGVGNL